MIAGLGIDLVDVGRMARNIRSEAFLHKVFTANEVADCRSFRNAAERFAGKLAAKEALMKALGQGIRQGVWFLQIEVLNRESGEPYVLLRGEAEKILDELQVECIHLSISHTHGVAAAVVILER